VTVEVQPIAISIVVGPPGFLTFLATVFTAFLATIITTLLPTMVTTVIAIRIPIPPLLTVTGNFAILQIRPTRLFGCRRLFARFAVFGVTIQQSLVHLLQLFPWYPVVSQWPDG
jgi:hypothetical protein